MTQEIANFAILRTKKYSSLQAITGIAKHQTREIACLTADATKTSKNVFWGAGDSAASVRKKVTSIIAEAQKTAPKKFRENTVKVIEYLMTASPDFWKTATKEQKNSYLKKCRSWLEERHGAGCVVATWLHVDEASPHLAALVVPLHNGVLNAKHFLGGAEKMVALQTDFHTQCGEPFGLLRGIEKSNAIHTPSAVWNAALNSPSPSPSRVDYAKAAIGIIAPSIELVTQQAQALKAFKTEQINVRKRLKKCDLRERKLAVQESELGDTMKLALKVKELEKENILLKSKVTSLEAKTGAYTPGTGFNVR